ncbi:MAG: fasciclin domain-containing protein [Halobacteriaceae archaeon]
MTSTPNRRSILQGLGAAGAVLTVGVAPATARGRRGASAESTIFDIVDASDQFTILELALEETGLDTILDRTDDQYTVFAPTDAAFAALLEDLDITAADLLADPDLPTILLYHVTTGRRIAASVVRAPRIEMVNGDIVTVDGATLNDGQATITTTDVEAANGIVHVIDGVLLP